jgi:hypothetical protein
LSLSRRSAPSVYTGGGLRAGDAPTGDASLVRADEAVRIGLAEALRKVSAQQGAVLSALAGQVLAALPGD